MAFARLVLLRPYGDRKSGPTGLCSGNTNLIGSERVSTANQGRLVIAQAIDKMLQLGTISIAESLHQVWRYVVLSPGTGQ